MEMHGLIKKAFMAVGFSIWDSLSSIVESEEKTSFDTRVSEKFIAKRNGSANRGKPSEDEKSI